MSHNGHYSTSNDSYQRRKVARRDLRLSNPAEARQLDEQDRDYFRHTYLKRAERRVREQLASLASNPRLPLVTKAYAAHLLSLGPLEHIQPCFLQTILNIETQGEGSEEREREVEAMFAEGHNDGMREESREGGRDKHIWAERERESNANYK
jgi:hypothetical protein